MGYPCAGIYPGRFEVSTVRHYTVFAMWTFVMFFFLSVYSQLVDMMFTAVHVMVCSHSEGWKRCASEFMG